MVTKLFIVRCLADDFVSAEIFPIRALTGAPIRTDFGPSLAYQVVVLTHLHCIYFGLHAVS